MGHVPIPFVPFYFLRHGETQWNRERLIMGQTDIPLSSSGIDQAQQAALACQSLDVDRIFTSPLLRAKQTAEVIQSHLNLPLTTADALKECTWGKAEGTPLTDQWDFQNWLRGEIHEGGEAFPIFQHRVLNVLSDLLKVSQKQMLIVSHNAVGWVLMRVLLGHTHFHQHIHHCTPYLFQPPKTAGEQWSLKQVSVPS